MFSASFFFAGIASVPLAIALSIASRSTDAVAFVDPVSGGGSWFDDAGSGGGEPLNVCTIFVPIPIQS